MRKSLRRSPPFSYALTCPRLRREANAKHIKKEATNAATQMCLLYFMVIMYLDSQQLPRNLTREDVLRIEHWFAWRAD